MLSYCVPEVAVLQALVGVKETLKVKGFVVFQVWPARFGLFSMNNDAGRMGTTAGKFSCIGECAPN